MERVVSLCGAGSKCCPAVEVSQDGVVIGEGENLVRLTPEQWDLIVAKVKSGELATFEEMTSDYGCDCGCCE
ncbi:MAG: hypothetical protein HY529_05585 [Chloroflexi bacterium]|nr:hypothetical protein [Chloroflexota bacterium]